MWNWFPKNNPLPVKSGLKARNTRGQFGQKWWSKGLIDVFEQSGEKKRLSRGRTYARKGQVIDLEISPGMVQGKVQGSRWTPYKITLQFMPLTPTEWQNIETAISASPKIASALLAREFPQELETLFSRLGAELLPSSIRTMGIYCSCPDWDAPCKHAAAVGYLLSERFEDNPLLLFQWRGGDPERILKALKNSPHQTHDTEPLDEPSLSQFWEKDPIFTGFSYHFEPPELATGALDRLGPSHFESGSKTLEERLALMYQGVTERAFALSKGELPWRGLLPEPTSPSVVEEKDPLDVLYQAYMALDTEQRRAVFGPWCQTLQGFESDDGWVDMVNLWQDPDALLDMLVDEDASLIQSLIQRASEFLK